jgi:hypothetical protein
MSYFENISSLIDNEVSCLLKNVSIKYNLNEDDVIEMWKTQKSSSEKKTPSVPSAPSTVDNQLMKLGRNELVEMCKGKGLKVGGTKNDLVSRIQQYENNKTNNVFKTENEKSQVKSNGQQASNVVINKLVEKIPVIEIKKNKFGNYEHYDSSLVFDNKTQKIYGKQSSDGTILKLTKEDIDTCNKYKFSYVLPDNLDEDDDEEIEYEEVVEVDDEQAADEEEDDDEEHDEEEEEEEEEEEIELDEEYE